MLFIRLFLANTWKNRGLPGLFPHKLPWNVVMDSEMTLRRQYWRGGDWDKTQNGAHVMRRKGCAMQNQGITLSGMLFSWKKKKKKTKKKRKKCLALDPLFFPSLKCICGACSNLQRAAINKAWVDCRTTKDKTKRRRNYNLAYAQ